MNKKQLVVIWLVLFLLGGCATVNFSSKYYNLPSEYTRDVEETWNFILSNTKTPLKNRSRYSYKIVKDNGTSQAGIPEIKNNNGQGVIFIPDYFLRYIWEFYYPKYHKEILGCILLHEIAHPESGYSDRPPKIHYLCDKYAIINLLPPSYTAGTFYSAQIVIKEYWAARKGLGGHLFNVGWNALNIFSLAYAGAGSIGDLYATDLNYRLSVMKKDFPNVAFCFKRNSARNQIASNAAAPN